MLTDDKSTSNLLFVQHCPNFTGSTISGYLIASGLIKSGWTLDVVFGASGPYIQRYQAIGCRVHVVPHKNWLRGGGVIRSGRRIVAEVAASRRFLPLMKQLRPAVVYVNSLVSLAPVIAAQQLGLPVVWHLRELFEDVGGEMRIPACGGKRLVRSILNRFASRTVSISASVCQNLLGPGDHPRNSIVPNAVGSEFFDALGNVEDCRRVLALPPHVPIVGVPGTLRPVKGHEFFLDAAALILRQIPDCSFAVTGQGEVEYVEHLKGKARELGVENSIFWLGTVEHMPAFYRACDVICIPSQSESFGRTAIEGFACQSPVIASSVGGLRETIEDGVNGILVPYGDSRRLADEAVSLLQDETGRGRLARQARCDVEGKYHESIYQRRIADIVDSLAAPRNSSRA